LRAEVVLNFSICNS